MQAEGKYAAACCGGKALVEGSVHYGVLVCLLRSWRVGCVFVIVPVLLHVGLVRTKTRLQYPLPSIIYTIYKITKIIVHSVPLLPCLLFFSRKRRTEEE